MIHSRMPFGRMMYSRSTFGRMILSRLIFSRVPFLLHLAEWYSAVSRVPFFTTILSKMTFNRITQQNGLNQNATTTVTLFIMLLLTRMLSLPSSISYLYEAWVSSFIFGVPWHFTWYSVECHISKLYSPQPKARMTLNWMTHQNVLNQNVLNQNVLNQNVFNQNAT